MKRGIVLAGGGMMGAFEAGFVRAIKELNIDYNIVTGTSIGALNGCLLAQKDIDKFEYLWDNMEANYVVAGKVPTNFDMKDLLKEANLATNFFKKFVSEKGANVTPLKILINEYYDYDKLMASDIDFGLVTVTFPLLKPALITKKDMEVFGREYLLASASAYPAFPKAPVDSKEYIDGGYYDNCPIAFAINLGAEELLVVDLGTTPLHPEYLERPNITYIHPYEELGGFLNFDRERLMKNKLLGYLGAMKAFKKYEGYKYTFELFDTPKYFESFYLEISKFEIVAKNAFMNKETTFYTKRVQEYTGIHKLSYKDYGLATIDSILSLLKVDTCNVYKYSDMEQLIYDNFKEYVDPTYEAIPKSVTDVVKFMTNMDQKVIIGKIVNILFTKQDIVINNPITTEVLTNEVVYAMFIKEIMMEKENEKNS